LCLALHGVRPHGRSSKACPRRLARTIAVGQVHEARGADGGQGHGVQRRLEACGE
jgi:hypothetical protein